MSTEEFENSTQDPSNNVTINIEGDTTYPNGVEYLVTAEDVHITVNDKRIPLTLKVTSTTDLGNNDEDYFTNRGGSTNIHKVLSGGVVVDGQYLVVGYIAPGQTAVEGSLNISAYINSDNIVISDTYDGTESDNMGTTNEWVGNKTVFTTSEWNSLSTSSNSLSFKIRVEANEGIWVEEATTPNLMNYININRNAVNIKEIRFIEETPLRMQRRYDASVGQESNGTKADLTYQETGKVLAWVEPITVNPTGTSSNLNIKPSFLVNENQDNNVKQIANETSYILYIASSGKTKWVTGSSLFGGFTTVEKITFENVDSSEVTSMSGMFPYLSNLKSIVGINKLDTSDVTNMSGMFNNCTNLVSIDLSGMGSDKLTNVSGMFSGCTSLTTIIMKNFNFGTNVSGAFTGLSNVETIDLSNSNMNNVSSLAGMFSGSTKLKSVNFKGVTTENVESMGNMFGGCSSLISIDLSGMGSDKLTTVGNMFSGCTSLTTINMSNFNFGTSNFGYNSSTRTYFSPLANLSNVTSINLKGANTTGVTDMSYMFSNSIKLTAIDLSGLGGNSLTNVSAMFGGCTSLTNINMSNFNFGLTEDLSYLLSIGSTNNISEVKLNGSIMNNVTNMTAMFQNCTSLTSIDLSELGSNSLTSVGGMFYNCSSLIAINMSNFNFGLTEDLSHLFFTESTNNVSEIKLIGSIMNNVTNMSYLFSEYSKLTSIDLSGLGSNSLTSAHGMFSGCTGLTAINMSNFNFGTAQINSSIFPNAKNLETLNLSNANTSRVESMSFMFDGNTKLKTVKLSGIDTSNQTSFQAMFRNCSSLTTLDLTSFDTTNVTAMHNMFSGCTSLKNIDLSSFDTNSLTVASGIFQNCSFLQTIYVSNSWNLSNVIDNSDSIFSGCTSLVGGNGTVFDSTKTDKTMAVIDTASTPGYLTLKTS